ncbi:MAG: hypothetical protein ACRD1Y_00540 [Terriglobales bacterium]
MGDLIRAARDGAAAVLLLAGVIAAAQWILRRLYGETDQQP